MVVTRNLYFNWKLLKYLYICLIIFNTALFSVGLLFCNMKLGLLWWQFFFFLYVMLHRVYLYHYFQCNHTERNKIWCKSYINCEKLIFILVYPLYVCFSIINVLLCMWFPAFVIVSEILWRDPYLRVWLKQYSEAWVYSFHFTDYLTTFEIVSFQVL